MNKEKNKNKELLIEYWGTFKPTTKLREGKEDGTYIVTGKIQEAEVKNANGRVYPKDILEEAINYYIEDFVDDNNAYGELDHPSSNIVTLANASHRIIKIWWEGNNVMADILIMDTPNGRIVKEIINTGGKIGISSRGLGSVTKLDENTLEVNNDLEMVAWDFVSNPSSPGAFMKKKGNNDNSLNENKEILKEHNYSKLNSLITELICDINGNCKLN